MGKKKIRVMWHGFKGHRKVRDSGAIALQNLGNRLLDQQRKQRKEQQHRTEPPPGMVKELKKWVAKKFRQIFCCFYIKPRNSAARFDVGMYVPSTSGMVSIYTTHIHSSSCGSYNSSWNPERCIYDSLDEYSEDDYDQSNWSKPRPLSKIFPLKHEFIKMNGNGRQRANQEKELPGKIIDGNDVEIAETDDDQHGEDIAPFSSPKPDSEILQKHINEIAIIPNACSGDNSTADPPVKLYCSHAEKDFTGNGDSNSLNGESDSDEPEYNSISESTTGPSSSALPLTTATELYDATLISNACDLDHMTVVQLEEDALPISSTKTICPKLQLDNIQLATRFSSPLTITREISEDFEFDSPKYGIPTSLEPTELPGKNIHGNDVEIAETGDDQHEEDVAPFSSPKPGSEILQKHINEIVINQNACSGNNSTADAPVELYCSHTEKDFNGNDDSNSLNEESDSDEPDYSDISESTTEPSSSTLPSTTATELSDPDATLISNACDVDHMTVGQLEEDALPVSSTNTICPKLKLNNIQLATRFSSPLTITNGISEDFEFDLPKCRTPTFLETMEQTTDIEFDFNSNSDENAAADDLPQRRCVNTMNCYIDIKEENSLNESSDSDKHDYTDV